MGINIAESIDYEKEHMKWFDYAFGGLIFTYKLSVMMVQGIWQLITGQVSLKSVMGPIGIVAVTKEVVKTGFIDTLLFFALININLAIINLLPFPALDGGHTLILSIERSFRIKIKPKTKEIINQVIKTLEDNKIKCKVTGRAKYFYSIYDKMLKEKKSFDDIYDLIGIRIVTLNKEEDRKSVV